MYYKNIKKIFFFFTGEKTNVYEINMPMQKRGYFMFRTLFRKNLYSKISVRRQQGENMR